MSQLFPLYRMGINEFFDTCKQLAEHMRVTSWCPGLQCPRLTVYKATVDPRTKQILCLQYELLHITFWKAAIALHFVGTNSTLQAFQRRKDYRTFTVTPSWVQMEARRIHCGSWEVKTPAYTRLVTYEDISWTGWLLQVAPWWNCALSGPPPNSSRSPLGTTLALCGTGVLLSLHS